MSLSAWRAQLDRSAQAVGAIVLVGLAARLVLLGDRVQHFDEGRVAWWTLEFFRTGGFEYRYIIHGPFIQHVNTWVFSALGPTDFSSRLVVALVGGLLPLTALLFRERLREAEVVAVAGFLAFNPLLLYYSRFLRSSVLVAAFMFVAFGLLVRYLDTRRLRYVHLAAVFIALGFTAKENSIVYLLSWLGAGGLVGALVLYARPDGRTGADRLQDWLATLSRPALDDLGRLAGHAGLAVGLFLAVIVFFYAPRGGPAGLGAALANPAVLPETWSSMVSSIESGYVYWFGHTSQPGCHQDNLIDAYACFLGRSLEVLASYAAPLVVLSLVGLVVEHVAASRPRGLVLFCGFWGIASVFGYPLGTDVFGAWIMVNALVPLAVPAGVGLGLIYRTGVDLEGDDDRIGATVAAAVIVLIAGQMAVVGVSSSYVDPTADENGLVQYAQPAQEWRGTLTDLQRLSRDTEGADVLFYGSHFVDGDTQAVRTPACIRWFNALPLPWYLDKDRIDVTCANTTGQLGPPETLPPVVITHDRNRGELNDYLGAAYEARTLYLRTVGVETVVYVRD